MRIQEREPLRLDMHDNSARDAGRLASRLQLAYAAQRRSLVRGPEGPQLRGEVRSGDSNTEHGRADGGKSIYQRKR